MELIELEVTGREALGSGKSRQLRRQGKIPAVMYSEGSAAKALTIDALGFYRSTMNRSKTQVYLLKSDLGALNGKTVILKEVSLDALRGEPLHVDLYELHEGHGITMTVALKIKGEPKALKMGDFIFNQVLHEVDIECLPRSIPECIEVDVSRLEPGDLIQAQNLVLPDGVKLVTDGNAAVASIIARRQEEAAVSETPADQPAETAAEAPAEK